LAPRVASFDPGACALRLTGFGMALFGLISTVPDHTSATRALDVVGDRVYRVRRPAELRPRAESRMSLSGSNRFARVVLGVVFATIAFVIERRVIKAIKKGQLGPKKEPATELAATSTSDGVRVKRDEPGPRG
jgi:hypothetical protein